jgi:hypothetical protein
MSGDGPFVKRLVDAIQVSHEATMQLQQLATELIDHAQRMHTYVDKLHTLKAELAPPAAPIVTFQGPEMDMNRMPTVLRGGPRERDG